MTQERLTELRADAEKCMEQGEGYHPHVGAKELLAMVDLAEAMLERRKKIRDQVALLRAKKGGKPAKAAQEGGKRPKKASGEETADTVEAMTEKLEALKRERAPVKSEALAPNIPANIPASDPLEPVFREKVVAKFPKPQESALPASFKSVLFSRVKTPAQIQHNPAATQFKTAKPKKP
jgi:hypothetical protein